jgi:hypothetical protein
MVSGVPEDWQRECAEIVGSSSGPAETVASVRKWNEIALLVWYSLAGIPPLRPQCTFSPFPHPQMASITARSSPMRSSRRAMAMETAMGIARECATNDRLMRI